MGFFMGLGQYGHIYMDVGYCLGHYACEADRMGSFNTTKKKQKISHGIIFINSSIP